MSDACTTCGQDVFLCCAENTKGESPPCCGSCSHYDDADEATRAALVEERLVAGTMDESERQRIGSLGHSCGDPECDFAKTYLAQESDDADATDDDRMTWTEMANAVGCGPAEQHPL